MKFRPLLGAALALALGASGAHARLSSEPVSSAIEPPSALGSLTLTSPDALAGLDFHATGYGSGVLLAPRGWVRYGPGWAPRGGWWDGSLVYYRPRRFGMHPPIRETVVYRPLPPASPPPASAPAKQANPASSSSAITVPVQIHGGFFAHEEYGPRSYAGGFRAGPAIDKHVQIGLGVDWYHRTDSDREIVADTVHAGNTVEVTRELSQATSDQIPLLLFLQVSVGKGVVPYAGIAGEYQFLLLRATDNTTGAAYEANFGGLGWQAWGGLGIDFGRSRLFGEVFINAGDVERDVSEPSRVGTYRETINADGGGARFGLSYGF
jgi:hypothetical protein